MPNVPTQYRHVCEICNSIFFSDQKRAMYDTTACKQVAYRRRKLQRALEKKFQLDMETYSLFQQIIDRTPTLLPYLTEFLKDHDQDTFTRVLQMITVTQLSVTQGINQTSFQLTPQ